MARKLRLQYAGAIYHLMSRGDRREPIFLDDADRESFLETLGQACAKTQWQVHAYCLMGNHFHLVVETPQANLVVGMKWLLGTYTARFNRRHNLSGHLFSGRYKSLILDGSGNGYLKAACDYVHLNPVRPKLVRPEQRLKCYRWSSYREYLRPSRQRPGWLRVDRLLGEMHIPEDSAAGRRRFGSIMEERKGGRAEGEFKTMRRGWYLGGKQFGLELLGQMAGQMGANHYGSERRECEEEEARRLVSEELRRLGWAEAELGRRQKGDPEKVKIARRVRTETTMTLKWIAARLQMGTWTNVSNLLAAAGRPNASRRYDLCQK